MFCPHSFILAHPASLGPACKVRTRLASAPVFPIPYARVLPFSRKECNTRGSWPEYIPSTPAVDTNLSSPGHIDLMIVNHPFMNGGWLEMRSLREI
jgi:hypothetical protein